MAAYEAVVIGVSAGGFQALPEVLSPLPEAFPAAVVVVQHVSPAADQDFFIEHLGRQLRMGVREAEERAPVVAGIVYIAPPGYHLLIEADRTFSLSMAERVKFSRPAIDVLFESAARVYGGRLIGVILTGANDDGAAGLKAIRDHCGLTAVQDPATAASAAMPAAAISAGGARYVLPLNEMSPFLVCRVMSTGRGASEVDALRAGARGPLPAGRSSMEDKRPSVRMEGKKP